MKKLLIAVGLLFAASAFGAAPLSSPAGPAPVACKPGSLKIATGKKGKGYSKLYDDVVAVCGEQIATCEVKTEGGLDNLSTLSYKKADIALAQIDTVKDMASGDQNIADLQAVATLNYNYLHILTSSKGYTMSGPRKWGGYVEGDKVSFRIQKLSDLKNKRVILVGSAQLLGRTLLARTLKGYNLDFEDVTTDKEAFAKVVSGHAVAMFTVAGLPHGDVEDLTQASGLTLVPFDEDVGHPYAIRKINYKNLGVYNLKALAVQNVLMSRPFGAVKATQVGNFRQCLLDNLTTLKDGEFQPAWNEMRLDTAVDLPKFNVPGGNSNTVKRK